jgi:hypothetical protein
MMVSISFATQTSILYRLSAQALEKMQQQHLQAAATF